MLPRPTTYRQAVDFESEQIVPIGDLAKRHFSVLRYLQKVCMADLYSYTVHDKFKIRRIQMI